MPYVLLAFGALLFVIGLYAVITGYPIVQIEQGWTSVIAGATLIAGSTVAMALALVLRTLMQLRADLRAGVVAALPMAEAQPALEPSRVDAAPDEADHPPLAAPLDPPPLEAPVRQPEPSFHEHHDGVLDTAGLDDIRFDEAHPSQAGFAPVPPPPSPPPAPEPAAVPEPAATAQASAPEPASGSARRPILSRLRPLRPVPPPSEPEPALPEPPPAPPAEPPRDWLDRALADIDVEAPAAKPEPATPVAPPVSEDPVQPEAVAPPPPNPVPPAPAPEPPPPAADPEPQTAAPTATVIGRYESDGTSYVMYADGSIEAHTDSGVYRFASMAELKTFIER